jgi:hypothetical protein
MVMATQPVVPSRRPDMFSTIRRLAAVALTVAAALFGQPATQALAKEAPVYTSFFSDVAVSGYDPVAYFTTSKPAEGKKEFSTRWMDTEWRFASPANRDLFIANPQKYAPQYGGYCAWAVSQGYTASADPKLWKIVDDKLYLNYDQDVQKKWEADIPGLIRQADRNWPSVLGR